MSNIKANNKEEFFNQKKGLNISNPHVHAKYQSPISAKFAIFFKCDLLNPKIFV